MYQKHRGNNWHQISTHNWHLEIKKSNFSPFLNFIPNWFLSIGGSNINSIRCLPFNKFLFNLSWIFFCQTLFHFCLFRLNLDCVQLCLTMWHFSRITDVSLNYDCCFKLFDLTPPFISTWSGTSTYEHIGR